MRNTRHKKVMKYELCVELCQHDFTIAIVVKLLVNGHCSDSSLQSLPSRSSRCPRLNASCSSYELGNIYAVFESQELTQTFAKTFKIQYFILCATCVQQQKTSILS